jgi:MFS family permease
LSGCRDPGIDSYNHGPQEGALIARFFADTTPLSASRDYRLLFSGQAISLVGRQLTVVAAPIQIYGLTGSTLMVGMLGLAQFPALFFGSFVGGALADSRDRRRVFLWAQAFLAVTTAGLAINAALASPSVAAIFVLTSANAFLAGIDSPARTASIPRIVSPETLPAAIALQVLMFQTANAVGPAIAGIIISQWSLSAAYWIDTMTFGAAIVAVFMMAPIPPPPDADRAGFKSILEGLRFLRSKQELKGVFLIDINAMVLGMPRALFPELGLSVFGGSEATVGYLFAAPGIGAMLAAVTSGWVGRVRRLGRATTIAVIVWGIGIAGFGLSPWLWLALALLALAGAGDAISAVFRSTMLQLTTPDRLRGRLSAVQIAVVAGDAEAGVVAAGFGPRVAAWSGGLASAAGALVIARLLPAFRDWVRPGPGEAPR